MRTARPPVPPPMSRTSRGASCPDRSSGSRPDHTTAVRVEPRLASNDGEVVREWAVAGRGVIVRSEWSVAGDLGAGRLVRLLPDWRLPAADVVAFVGPRRGRSARTGRFVEYLREALTPVPWRAGSNLLPGEHSQRFG